jgi:hypothetical protein
MQEYMQQLDEGLKPTFFFKISRFLQPIIRCLTFYRVGINLHVQPTGIVFEHYCDNFVGLFPHRDKDYSIGSNFWKFYLIRIDFPLGEPVSLVKVFRLFRLERIVLVFRVWTQEADVQHLIYWQGQSVCDALFGVPQCM